MAKKLRFALVGALVLALGGATMASAGGDRHKLRTNLTGYEEVVPISTSGGGTFRATINKDKTRIDYKLWFSGTEGTVTQSHIHFGQEGVNGGIMVFLCSNLGNGPAGTQACPTEGLVEGSLDASSVVGPAGQGIAAGEFAEVISVIRAGVAYVNVHSTLYPGGEIRGQLDSRGDWWGWWN